MSGPARSGVDRLPREVRRPLGSGFCGGGLGGTTWATSRSTRCSIYAPRVARRRSSRSCRAAEDGGRHDARRRLRPLLLRRRLHDGFLIDTHGLAARPRPGRSCCARPDAGSARRTEAGIRLRELNEAARGAVSRSRTWAATTRRRRRRALDLDARLRSSASGRSPASRARSTSSPPTAAPTASTQPAAHRPSAPAAAAPGRQLVQDDDTFDAAVSGWAAWADLLGRARGRARPTASRRCGPSPWAPGQGRSAEGAVLRASATTSCSSTRTERNGAAAVSSRDPSPGAAPADPPRGPQLLRRAGRRAPASGGPQPDPRPVAALAPQ